MVAILALVYWFTDSVWTTVGIALGVVLIESRGVLRETPSIDDQSLAVGEGVFILLASLAWLTYELTAGAGTGGPAWFPALTALAGGWFLLDARRGPDREPWSERDEEMDAGEVMLVMNHAHLITDELEKAPRTVPELAEACDLTESRVREALAFATDDDVVYRVDDDPAEADRYALDESKVGAVAFVRSNGRRILRRLARPFRS